MVEVINEAKQVGDQIQITGTAGPDDMQIAYQGICMICERHREDAASALSIASMAFTFIVIDMFHQIGFDLDAAESLMAQTVKQARFHVASVAMNASEGGLA